MAGAAALRRDLHRVKLREILRRRILWCIVEIDGAGRVCEVGRIGVKVRLSVGFVGLFVGIDEFESGSDRPQVRLASRGLRLRSCVHEVRNQDAGENRDDRNDDHQLDERKTPFPSALHDRIPPNRPVIVIAIVPASNGIMLR